MLPLRAGAAIAILAAAIPCLENPPSIRVPEHGATPVPSPTPSLELSDADVTEFLRAWPVWSDALATLGDGSPPPAGGDPLDAADVAMEKSAAVRDALEASGIDGSRFMDLYRRVATAWYALQEAHEREQTDAAFDVQLRALGTVTGIADAPGASQVLARMRAVRILEELNERGLAIPQSALDAAERHRDALAAILGAADGATVAPTSSAPTRASTRTSPSPASGRAP